MKIAFSKPVDFIPTWNGNDKAFPDEQIKCRLTPLKLGTFLAMADATSGIQSSGSIEISTVSIAKLQPLLAYAVQVFPTNVELAGLLDEETGVPITSLQIAEDARLLPLVAEIIGKLLEISAPKGSDVKN
jgi:hypothetical protein